MNRAMLFLMAAAAIAAGPLFADKAYDDLIAMEARRQARSIHLGYENPQPNSDWAYGEATVRESQPGSYFMILGFTGGYFGIQELGDGSRIALFSVWDPGDPFDFSKHPDEVEEGMRTKALYAGKDVSIRRFGGEGTGGQSRIAFPWKTGEVCRVAINIARDGDHRLAFTAYLYRNESRSWFKMAAFSTISVKGAPRIQGIYSFVEDFRRNYDSAKKIRRADFTNFCVHETGRPGWAPILRAQFTGDRNPAMTVDAGPIPNGFFLQTGGATTNRTVKLWQKMATPAGARACPAECKLLPAK